MGIGVENSKNVKSTKEFKDVTEVSFSKMEERGFWNKPLAKNNYKVFKNSPLGRIDSGIKIDEGEGDSIITITPLESESSFLYSKTTPDRIFLMSQVLSRDTGVDDIKEIGSTPIAFVRIPYGVLMDSSTLSIFAFNFCYVIRKRIVEGDKNAVHLLENWVTSKTARNFIEASNRSGGKKDDSMLKLLERLKPLIQDEKKWKELFPELPSFSEWKKEEKNRALLDEAEKLGVNLDLNNIGNS